jgi:hypothetical protein
MRFCFLRSLLFQSSENIRNRVRNHDFLICVNLCNLWINPSVDRLHFVKNESSTDYTDLHRLRGEFSLARVFGYLLRDPYRALHSATPRG